jgi:hypothetical protein
MSSPSGKEPRLYGLSALSVITRMFIYEFPFDLFPQLLSGNLLSFVVIQ